MTVVGKYGLAGRALTEELGERGVIPSSHLSGGVTLGRSVSASEAAGFAVLVFALEVQHGSPAERAALAPPSTGMHCTMLAGASGCCCNPCHDMTLFSTKMLSFF